MPSATERCFAARADDVARTRPRVGATAMNRGPRANRSSRPPANQSDPADIFDAVVATFTGDRRVIRGVGKGFGSGALKVDGKIFAMISSKGEFVVKLPAHRVDELVRDGTGRQFDAGRGKKMKEWLALNGKSEIWTELAREARQFVGDR